MLSPHRHSYNHRLKNIFWPSVVILLIFIGSSDGVLAAVSRLGSEESEAPRHLNFFKTTLRTGRQRVLSCADDPSVCMDREKNPWGGSTCCFQQFCRDILRDSNNCGACGRTCGYGFVCCGGKCVDVQNDYQHCGSCFEECPGHGRCSFAMCDYGG